jgi:hypothetical protein
LDQKYKYTFDFAIATSSRLHIKLRRTQQEIGGGGRYTPFKKVKYKSRREMN